MSEWKVNTDVSSVTSLLSLRVSVPLFLPRLSFQRGKIPHGKQLLQPLLEKSQALGSLQPQCGCTLFADSRMFFLWWARDFISSNSDIEYQPLGPRNVRHGLSEMRAATSSVMGVIFTLFGKHTRTSVVNQGVGSEQK